MTPTPDQVTRLIALARERLGADVSDAEYALRWAKAWIGTITDGPLNSPLYLRLAADSATLAVLRAYNSPATPPHEGLCAVRVWATTGDIPALIAALEALPSKETHA